jgi:hypothetical protein
MEVDEKAAEKKDQEDLSEYKLDEYDKGPSQKGTSMESQRTNRDKKFRWRVILEHQGFDVL